MKIHLRNFPPDGQAYEGEEPPEILDFEAEVIKLDAPIGYKFYATLSATELVAIGRIWTNVGIKCVRCLKDSRVPVEVPTFVAHHEVTPAQDFVDLTANLREDILLALPQNPLCTAGCRGLCPGCGQDLNEVTCSCAARKASAGIPLGGTGKSATAWSALDRIKIVKES